MPNTDYFRTPVQAIVVHYDVHVMSTNLNRFQDMGISEYSLACAGLGHILPELIPGLALSEIFTYGMTYLNLYVFHFLVNHVDRVRHIEPQSINSIQDLVSSMDAVGVLGAGRLGRAAKIMRRMFDDADCFTYLAMSGPMVPGGLRHIISHLVKKGHIDVIVTSGANIVHDLVEAYGGNHHRVSLGQTDEKLRHAGMGRIADIYVEEKHFETLEKKIYDFLDSLSPEQHISLAPSEFLHELGLTLDDEKSIVHQAALRNVPILSPGLMDSMLGFHLFTYSTMKTLSLDFIKDLRILASMVNVVKKTGAIILGGGLSKHFTMGSTILRGGLDLALQITLDRPEAGSLSGAPLQEGVSWQKVQTEASFESVIGDATIIFPLLVMATIDSK